MDCRGLSALLRGCGQGDHSSLCAVTQTDQYSHYTITIAIVITQPLALGLLPEPTHSPRAVNKIPNPADIRIPTAPHLDAQQVRIMPIRCTFPVQIAHHDPGHEGYPLWGSLYAGASLPVCGKLGGGH